MEDQNQTQEGYPAEFLELVDQFVSLCNALAAEHGTGRVSAAILFAAGRYNAFNFLALGGGDPDRAAAIEFYVSEYRKAFESNLRGDVGPVVKGAG